MLEQVLFARGVLVPTKPENVTEDTADAIRKALAEQDLWWVAAIFDAENGLHIQSGVSVDPEDLPNNMLLSSGPRHHARNFAGAMKTIVQTEGVANLELEGSLIVTIDTDEEIYVSSVTFKNSEVRFHEAKVNWKVESSWII